MKEMILALLTLILPMHTAVEVEKAPAMKKSVQAVEAVTVIGDSLTVSITPRLNQIEGKEIYVDGKIGRQVRELHSVYNRMKNNDKLGQTLVIALGTNGPYDEAMIQEVINDARKNGVERFFLVNVRMARTWQDEVNQTHAKLVKENQQDTRLINWYQASRNHKEYFAADSVHLSEQGKKVYVQLLEKNIG